MPNLQRLMERGVSGVLRASSPLLSPTSWTTIVTGVGPTKHRVLGPLEMRGDKVGLQLVGRSSQQAPAVWSILEAAGVACHTINFPATHPAEGTRGVSISNMYPLTRDKRVLEAAVRPAAFLKTLEPLRIGVNEIDQASLLTFVPEAKEIEQRTDPRLGAIAQILAHTATVHAAATAVLEQVEWDFAAVCYMGLHQFSHMFMAYHPPYRPGVVEERDFRLYQHVITAAYRFHDLLLGRLVELAGEDATVMVVSDHGFHSDRLRPGGAPASEEAMLQWHREEGVLVASGSGISRGGVAARGVDVTPTILGLFGVNKTAEMPGEPLFGAGGALRPAPGVESEEVVSAGVGQAEDGGVDYLLALGYAEHPDPIAAFVDEHFEQRRDYYLAIAWLEEGNPREAVGLLEGLVKARPGKREFETALALAYARGRRLEDARRVVERLASVSETPLALAGLASLEMAARRAQSALEHLRRAQGMGLKSPMLAADVGRALLRLGRVEEAKRAFEEALAQDGELAEGHLGLSAVYSLRGEPALAVEAARRSLALRPENGEGYYRLGAGLLALGRLDEARVALEQAQGWDSGALLVLRKLAEVYERLGDRGKAREVDALAHAAVVRARVRGRGLEAGMVVRRRREAKVE
jgi:tetratricopeptide (TPR) repeat protein